MVYFPTTWIFLFILLRIFKLINFWQKVLRMFLAYNCKFSMEVFQLFFNHILIILELVQNKNKYYQETLISYNCIKLFFELKILWCEQIFLKISCKKLDDITFPLTWITICDFLQRHDPINSEKSTLFTKVWWLSSAYKWKQR